MKTIVISGCNGLIGYELSKMLSENGNYNVYGISRTKPLIENSNFHHIYTDFTQKNFENVLPKKVDVVAHLAQSEFFRDFPDRVQNIFDVNVSSTLKLLEYCRKAGGSNFVYASSGGIYGTSEKGFDEEDHVAPHGELGFYLSTKLCSEILVENYSQFFNIIISRLFFVYGKRQKKSMLIPRLVENIKKGAPIQLQGTEGIMINPIHVTDAVMGLKKCLELKENHKINIGGNQLMSLKEICTIIGNKVKAIPVFECNENVKPKNLFSNINRMKDLLIEPAIKFEDGIMEIIQLK
ncbi:MAG TPA: NAD(P)-dependent oxidoreductase [Bacteroidia bacterium]|jgi:UDP-glucose 4-epimerase|nr:NAD(P)-dependent oxidoreductase [Bacteroidia bacterium]